MAKSQWCLLLLGALLCTATSQPDHEQDRRGKLPMLMKSQLAVGFSLFCIAGCTLDWSQ